MNTLSAGELLRMYRLMVRIREFEQKVTELFMEGLVPGTIHLYTGQEATAVGVITCLRRSDRVMLSHRPHGHALAKGIDPASLMSEILGRKDGCTGGVGGSMHIVDVERGIMPSIPIVGAGIPIAVGIAHALRALGSTDISVSFFGDGTTNIGAFHEALNLAAIWSLPVIFVCENNLYAVSTPIGSMTRAKTLATKASSYGLPSVTVDGNDVRAVYEVARDAVTRARDGHGPTFIESLTYRYSGHSRTDPGLYRTKEELERWEARDPLPRCRSMLVSGGEIDEAQIVKVEQEEKTLIDEAAHSARESPPASSQDGLPAVYAGEDVS